MTNVLMFLSFQINLESFSLFLGKEKGNVENRPPMLLLTSRSNRNFPFLACSKLWNCLGSLLKGNVMFHPRCQLPAPSTSATSAFAPSTAVASNEAAKLRHRLGLLSLGSFAVSGLVWSGLVPGPGSVRLASLCSKWQIAMLAGKLRWPGRGEGLYQGCG